MSTSYFHLLPNVRFVTKRLLPVGFKDDFKEISCKLIKSSPQ